MKVQDHRQEAHTSLHRMALSGRRDDPAVSVTLNFTKPDYNTCVLIILFCVFWGTFEIFYNKILRT